VVAKFLDDSKPKIHLKRVFALFQVFDLIKFHSARQCWGNFLGLNPKGPYLSSEKENVCAVFTCSIKQAREIRKFHVSVVHRRLRNVQKSVMHVQSYCFAKKLIAF